MPPSDGRNFVSSWLQRRRVGESGTFACAEPGVHQICRLVTNTCLAPSVGRLEQQILRTSISAPLKLSCEHTNNIRLWTLLIVCNHKKLRFQLQRCKRYMFRELFRRVECHYTTSSILCQSLSSRGAFSSVELCLKLNIRRFGKRFRNCIISCHKILRGQHVIIFHCAVRVVKFRGGRSPGQYGHRSHRSRIIPHKFLPTKIEPSYNIVLQLPVLSPVGCSVPFSTLKSTIEFTTDDSK